MKKRIALIIVAIIVAFIIAFVIAMSIGFERHIYFWVLNDLAKTERISFEYTSFEGDEKLIEIKDKETIKNIIKIAKGGKKRVSFNQAGLCYGPAYRLYMYDKNDELIDEIRLFYGDESESFSLGRDNSGCGPKFRNKDNKFGLINIILKEIDNAEDIK